MLLFGTWTNHLDRVIIFLNSTEHLFIMTLDSVSCEVKLNL